MAYSELIKDFNRIRDYMRQFYVYGFKTRDEYDAKSARSYDNERRRIESWLDAYMSFRQEPSGRVSFISIDSTEVPANPLYNAFKAKSFTANDIVLNFCILDILQPGERMGVSEITETIDEEYMSFFENPKVLDEATVRNKLNEYVKLGILISEKEGRKLLYRRSEDSVDLEQWKEALSFFSEIDPVGVIGSFLLDKMREHPGYFSFKHHYILHALESDIICTLLDAITDDCMINDKIIPYQICLSTENGRGYLLGRDMEAGRFQMYRLDKLQTVKKGAFAPQKAEFTEAAKAFTRYLWNVARGPKIEHLEMTLHIEPWENHILQRLKREGKHGVIEQVGENRYRYSIDVCSAAEMRPWLRTFIGRIEELSCSNPEVTKVFYEDLDQLYEMYEERGGDGNAVS